MAVGLAGDKPAVPHISASGSAVALDDSAPFSLLADGVRGGDRLELAACFLLGLKPESLDARDRLGCA